jgi:uncharacterized protein (DUF433 family)
VQEIEEHVMNTVADLERITFHPEVMGGKPCIRGLRVTIGTIVGLIAAGHSIKRILNAYPYLEKEDLEQVVELIMPEIARFDGIVIRMFTERGGRHHEPHFHAYYQEMVASYQIEKGQLLRGRLPTPQRRLVEAWARAHVMELLENWQRLQNDQPSFKIDS